MYKRPFLLTQTLLLISQQLLPFYHFQRTLVRYLITITHFFVLSRLFFFFPVACGFPSLQKKNAWTWTFQRRLPCFKFIKNILYKNGLKTFSVFTKFQSARALCTVRTRGDVKALGHAGVGGRLGRCR